MPSPSSYTKGSQNAMQYSLSPPPTIPTSGTKWTYVGNGSVGASNTQSNNTYDLKDGVLYYGGTNTPVPKEKQPTASTPSVSSAVLETDTVKYENKLSSPFQPTQTNTPLTNNTAKWKYMGTNTTNQNDYSLAPFTDTPQGRKLAGQRLSPTLSREGYSYEEIRKLSPETLKQINSGTYTTPTVKGDQFTDNFVYKTASTPSKDYVNKLNRFETDQNNFQTQVTNYQNKYGGKQLTESEFMQATQEQAKLNATQQKLNTTYNQLLLETKAEEARTNTRIEQTTKFLNTQQTMNAINETIKNTTPKISFITQDTGLINTNKLNFDSAPKNKSKTGEPNKISFIGENRGDISQAEFDKELKQLSEKNILFDYTIPNIQKGVKEFREKYPTFGTLENPFLTVKKKFSKGQKSYDTNYTFFENPLKEGISLGYDAVTDIAGTIITGGSREFRNAGFWQTEEARRKEARLKTSKLINARQVVIEDLKRDLPQELESDFYLGKQIAETGSYFIGSAPVKAFTMIGQASRAKTPEEIAIPLLLGVGTRIASPKIGNMLVNTINKVNPKLEKGLLTTERTLKGKAPRIFGYQTPVKQDTMTLSRYANLLTEHNVGKTLFVGGALAEVGGIAFVPNNQKYDYVRQIGLYNAITPIGYRVTDTGIALGKSAKTAVLTTIADIPVVTVKETMQPKTAKKFLKTGGGTPTTPKGTTEVELMQGLQGGKKFSKVDALAKKLDLPLKEIGFGAMFRSVDFKLPKRVKSFFARGNYESLVEFASTETHPIAFQGIGLKNRLLGRSPKLSDRFRLSSSNPAIEYILTPSGRAITFKGKKFTYKNYLELREYGGYKPVKKYFEFGAQGKKIGKIRINIQKTISEQEFAKIFSGGRSFKNRDIKALIGEEAFNRYFVKGTGKADLLGGARSTDSRIVQATGEAEVGFKGDRTRLEFPDKVIFSKKILGKEIKITREGIKKRFDLADAYLYVKGEYVPINVNVLDSPMNNKLLLTSGQKQITGNNKKLLTGETTKTRKNNIVPSKNTITPKNNYVTFKPQKGKGQYTLELEKQFGRKQALANTQPFIYRQNTRQPSLLTNYRGTRNTTRPETRRTITRTEIRRPTLFGSVTRTTPTRQPTRTPDIMRQTLSRPEIRRAPTRTPNYTPPFREPPRRPTLRNPPRTPPVRIPTGYPTPDQGSGYTPSYDVYVRKGLNGKNVKPQLVERGLTRNTALNTGMRIASKYTQRTVQLKQTGRTDRRDDNLDNRLYSQYTGLSKKSKIERKLINIVEKPRYAIDSREEKLGIPYKAQRLNRRKSIVNKLRMI